MPGIVGLITKMPRSRAESELRRMVVAICHEPSYATGIWIDEALGVYVGWAARKGSFLQSMPLRNERGDIVLILSGEEFPDPKTSVNLRLQGHSVDGEGPSYLV